MDNFRDVRLNDCLDKSCFSSKYKGEINPRQYALRIVDRKIWTNPCSILNDVILDNWGDYYYDYENALLDGKKVPLVFNSYGLSSVISALYENRIIRINLYKIPQEGKKLLPPEPINPKFECIDTPNGFKLSQIIEDLGDIEQISIDSTDGVGGNNNEPANLVMSQKAYIADRDCKKYVIFKFTIRNKINSSKIPLRGRRVLFKDIFPKGVSVLCDEIFLDDKHIDKDKVCLDGRRLFVKLPALDSGESCTLTVVCLLDKPNLLNECSVNIGALAYVSNNSLDTKENTLTTTVYTFLSNPITLSDIV